MPFEENSNCEMTVCSLPIPADESVDPEEKNALCMEVDSMSQNVRRIPAASPSSPLSIPQSESTTMILIDWDDTLLASTFLSSHGYKLDGHSDFPPDMRLQLRELQASVIRMLTVAIRHGDTTIVTNAETGWVQLSCQRFMPNVFQYLQSVNILSARSTYEADFPEAPSKWKVEAFNHTLKSIPAQHSKNVISLGDSQAEREALQIVSRELSDVRTKSVKFVERPTIEQLTKQLDLVITCFQGICEYEHDLDLLLSVNFP
eukprot:131210_1